MEAADAGETPRRGGRLEASRFQRRDVGAKARRLDLGDVEPLVAEVAEIIVEIAARYASRVFFAAPRSAASMSR